jgi:hypothetical protein
LDCPDANNTIYTSNKPGRRFLRVCGIDYTGSSGAVDMFHIPSPSFSDCLETCASTSGCTGCGWGVFQDNTTTERRCWLKNSLQEGHPVADWRFGILQ